MKNVTFKTRHALVLSCISLMTCFAMLLGTTFAWFTDSVTSGVNRIVAGNLDVELYHKTVGTTAGDPGDSVEGQTNLFDKSVDGTILWEPGAMAYETFTVKNVGTLDLNYKLALSQVGYNTVANTTKSLLDVIKVAEADDSVTPTRDNLKALFTAATPTLGQYISNGATAGASGTLLDKDSAQNTKSFTIALYWPSDTEGISSIKDDDYNLKNGAISSDNQPLWVDLKIVLVAGQMQSESDSFDNTYDSGASYADIKITNTLNATVQKAITANTEDTVTTTDNTASVTIPAVATTSDTTYKLTVQSTDTTTANISISDGNDATYFDVDLKTVTTTGTETTEVAAAELTGADYYTATVNVGANLDVKKVYHNDSVLATSAGSGNDEYYEYNATTGILTLHVHSFSPFAIEYTVPVAAIGSVGYTTLPAAVNAAKSGETVVLLKDITVDSSYASPESITGVSLDGNGHTVTVTANKPGWFVRENHGDVTVKNLTIKAEECEDYAPIRIDYSHSLSFVNVNLGDQSSRNTTLTFSGNNCGGFVLFPWGSNLTLDNCKNYYNITANGSDTGVGVFVGGYFSSQYSGTAYPISVAMKNCVNYGDVTAAHVGYLNGNDQSMQNVTITVTNCSNEGKLAYFKTGGFVARGNTSLNSTHNTLVTGLGGTNLYKKSSEDASSYAWGITAYPGYQKNGEAGTLQLSLLIPYYDGMTTTKPAYKVSADTISNPTDQMKDITGHYYCVVDGTNITIMPVDSAYTVTANNLTPSITYVALDANGGIVNVSDEFYIVGGGGGVTGGEVDN